MMNEINEQILTLCQQKFPQLSWPHDESYDIMSMEVPTNQLVEVIQYVKDELGYAFLTDICGIHIPGDVDKELGVIYHLHNWRTNHRIRIKTFVKVSSPRVPSMTSLWSGANWMERETYDFFGIEFTGHPDLRRILNMDQMDYFPLRKQYPLEDATRTDKNDKFFGR